MENSDNELALFLMTHFLLSCTIFIGSVTVWFITGIYGRFHINVQIRSKVKVVDSYDAF
jgi:hypothetical protein